MKKSLIQLMLKFVLVTFISIPKDIFAQAGSLDFSFDTDGIVTTFTGVAGFGGQSISVQSDSKIVVAGTTYFGGIDFALNRYLSNGALDTTFDLDGKTLIQLPSTTDGVYDMAIQNDGKILLAGVSSGWGIPPRFLIVRFNPNGSLDSTFNFDGALTTAIGAQSDEAYSIALQSDGKIIVGGVSYNGPGMCDIVVVRYKINGSLDSTFDNDGIAITSIGNTLDYCRSLKIQSDGKIVAIGYSHNGSNFDLAIVRYNINGSLDSTFDYDGIVTTPIGLSDDQGFFLAIQTDGKLIISGRYYNGFNNGSVLVRYNPNGGLDSTFDNDGVVFIPSNISGDFIKPIVLQQDGKILVAGADSNSTDTDFLLLRYNSIGTLDSTFDTDGIVTTPIGTADDFGKSIAIQSDGRILVAGTSINGTYPDFAIARYHSANNTGLIGINNLYEKIQIYPNPISSSASLRVTQFLHNATLKFCNFYGEVVEQVDNFSGQTINLSQINLPSGLYFIQVMENDITILRDKLVINY